MQDNDRLSSSEDKYKQPLGTARLTALGSVVGLVTLGVLLYPFNFTTPRSGSWLELTTVGALSLCGHIALFSPLGLCEGWIVQHIMRSRSLVALIVVIDVAGLSLVAETAQLWLPGRESALADLVAATIGGTIGALISEWIPSPLRERPRDPAS